MFNKVHTIVITILVVALTALIGVNAAFAQDEEPVTPDAPLCRPAHNGDFGPGSILEEAGLTREQVREHLQNGGTLQELLQENGIDIEALRAERMAERQQAALACIEAALDAGRLTEEQATALSDAIENGTLREQIQNGGFDGLFPRLQERRENFQERRENGEGFFGRRGNRGPRSDNPANT